MIPDSKICTGCGEVKGLDEFHKYRRGKYGCKPKCKICSARIRRAYYLSNNKKERKRARERLYASIYGVSSEWVELRMAELDGRCAICEQPETQPGFEVLSVDHSHSSLAARDLLCQLLQ